jgi:hypothetical protein
MNKQKEVTKRKKKFKTSNKDFFVLVNNRAVWCRRNKVTVSAIW